MKWLVALFLGLGVASAQAQSVGNASNFVHGPASSGACGSNFAQDSFTGTAGTNITAHTDDCGNSWSSADCTTSPASSNTLDGSGSVYIKFSSGAAVCYSTNSATPPSANYTVRANVTNSASSSSSGVLARFTNSATPNGYFLRANCGSSLLQLFRVDSGVTTLLGTAGSISCGNGTGVNEIKLVVNGSSLSGYFGGTLIDSATDSTYGSAGLVGIYNTNGNGLSTAVRITSQFNAHP